MHVFLWILSAVLVLFVMPIPLYWFIGTLIVGFISSVVYEALLEQSAPPPPPVQYYDNRQLHVHQPPLPPGDNTK